MFQTAVKNYTVPTPATQDFWGKLSFQWLKFMPHILQNSLWLSSQPAIQQPPTDIPDIAELHMMHTFVGKSWFVPRWETELKPVKVLTKNIKF